MSNGLLVTESTLTDRYQTTVPEAVRRALHLGKREKIRYTIKDDGSVVLTRADADESDPALSSFLKFLAKDIQDNPQRLESIAPELLSRIQGLVEGIHVNLDMPLDDEED